MSDDTCDNDCDCDGYSTAAMLRLDVDNLRKRLDMVEKDLVEKNTLVTTLRRERDEARAALNGELAMHGLTLATARSIAEAQREACAERVYDYVQGRPLLYEDQAAKALRATPLVTDAEVKP